MRASEGLDRVALPPGSPALEESSLQETQVRAERLLDDVLRAQFLSRVDETPVDIRGKDAAQSLRKSLAYLDDCEESVGWAALVSGPRRPVKPQVDQGE